MVEFFPSEFFFILKIGNRRNPLTMGRNRDSLKIRYCGGPLYVQMCISVNHWKKRSANNRTDNCRWPLMLYNNDTMLIQPWACFLFLPLFIFHIMILCLPSFPPLEMRLTKIDNFLQVFFVWNFISCLFSSISSDAKRSNLMTFLTVQTFSKS